MQATGGPAPAVGMPADSHVHSEWSWDADSGSMERSCARAVELGLPAIAFTEHVDRTVWAVDLDEIEADHALLGMVDAGRVTPAALDLSGYLECVDRCRRLFPSLRVLSGVELGEPHWHAEATAGLLGSGSFDRVLGSLHCLPDGDEFREPPGLYRRRDPGEVLRTYLVEVASMIAQCSAFAVLAHIDYPLRQWPEETSSLELTAFEDEFRHALRATAESGRALEISTVVPMHPTIVRWWREEGGQEVTFGSDAHDPAAVARRFRDAADMAEAHGFRPGREPFAFWSRDR